MEGWGVELLSCSVGEPHVGLSLNTGAAEETEGVGEEASEGEKDEEGSFDFAAVGYLDSVGNRDNVGWVVGSFDLFTLGLLLEEGFLVEDSEMEGIVVGSTVGREDKVGFILMDGFDDIANVG
mmetsp:Transcript_29837/g.42371  ORF Transcript_29837/g.42371 Transcript_29837/m.42371 type:complete len:123 (-) Transcript_29837:418-786(-)